MANSARRSTCGQAVEGSNASGLPPTRGGEQPRRHDRQPETELDAPRRLL